MLAYERSAVKCSECPLNDRNRVWGQGNLNSTNNGIILMGEAPGQQEDQYGVPFVGKAGQVLDDGLKEASIERSAGWTTNALVCRPPNNDFQSHEAQVARDKCRPGMREELDMLGEYGYRIIVPLGNNACKSIGVTGGITRIRGGVYEKMGFIVMPTFHPSYVARGLPKDPEERRNVSRWNLFVKDLLLVREKGEEYATVA